MLKGGFTGKVLRINLTKKTFAEEALREDVAAKYFGGAGIAIRYLLDEVPAACDPLGPENNLYMSLGPFCGTDIPGASRVMCVAKSPLTGAVGKSSAGGHFPAEVKYAGYDMIILEGKADEWTWLWIKDGKVTFRDAKELKGLSTSDTQQVIKDKLGDQNVRIACVGPAGENLNAYASIINEKRASGRKGLGAVMGSKNVKAIAIRGEKPVPVANAEKLKEATKAMTTAMKDSPILYPHFSHGGTPGIVDKIHGLGLLPSKNFATTGEWDPVDYFGHDIGIDEFNTTKEYCYRCPVGCAQVKLAKAGPHRGAASVPEFETIYSFGTTTLMTSFNEVIAADKLCDEFGMDTISCGVAIAFAMELYEKGIITKDDLGGIDLKWGNADAMIAMVTQIAHREGFGAILADGVQAAAKKIGKGAEKYAMHVKGLELPAYDVRGAKAHGLNYATGYTGADHCLGYAFQEVFSIPVPYAVDRFEYKGKGKLTKWNQDTHSVCLDAAPLCAFIMHMALAGFCHKNTADLSNGLVGTNFTPEDMMLVGERMNNAAKIFNIGAGFTRADDTLPERLKTEAMKEGGSKGHVVAEADLQAMLDEYYEERGWTKEGVPTKERLISLGMEEELSELGKYVEIS